MSSVAGFTVKARVEEGREQQPDSNANLRVRRAAENALMAQGKLSNASQNSQASTALAGPAPSDRSIFGLTPAPAPAEAAALLNTLKRGGPSADLEDAAESPPPLKKTRSDTPPDTSALPLLAPIPRRVDNIAAVLRDVQAAQIELVIDQLPESSPFELPQVPQPSNRSASGELLL